jgi:cytochrome o ubiquinol oxidase subunit 2
MRDFFGKITLLISLLFLSSCNDMVLLNPKGIIAEQQTNLLIISVLLMLIIVIPTIVITIYFAWKYNHKRNEEYDPNFYHNTKIEIICWGVPTFIVIILAVMTWFTSHSLDPYREIKSSKNDPIEIQVVALDWKWLFIYPEQKIASVNWLQIPVDTPINFKITADAPMNSFWIPALAGQIYAMPGMQTKLHIMSDSVGNYLGRSSNYSGTGFSGMKFNTRVSSRQDFNEWVTEVKNSNEKLDWTRYSELAKQTINHPVEYFKSVDMHLYHKIMDKFMNPNFGKKETNKHLNH